MALCKNGKTVALLEDYSATYTHAERLHQFINNLLKDYNITASQLNAIAVSKGPGSYTGLRIGISAAKGLCFALNIPLIAVETLKALAYQVIATTNDFIISMLDARRMEVYTAVYNNRYETIEPTNAAILHPQSYSNYLNSNSKTYFIGNGVKKAQTIIKHDNACFIEDKLPSADTMSVLAYTKFINNEFEDVAYFEPLYLKDFITSK